MKSLKKQKEGKRTTFKYFEPEQKWKRDKRKMQQYRERERQKKVRREERWRGRDLISTRETWQLCSSISEVYGISGRKSQRCS